MGAIIADAAAASVIIASMEELTHVDPSGKAHMVDVGEKTDSRRMAIASGDVVMAVGTLRLIRQNEQKKGDVLIPAQLAGIMAAKKTAELIPLCHNLVLNGVDVALNLDDTLPGVRIKATVHTIGKTGAEMEALTAVSVAALTIYDMVKAVEKTVKITNIRLLEKSGGKSGDVVLEKA